jgi:hypothetical protein
MKFVELTIENQQGQDIAANILNARAGRVGPKAHSITLEAIRQELESEWHYVIGSMDGVPCVVGSYDLSGIAVDIACLPEYRDRNAVESMLGYIEGKLTQHGTKSMVVVADPEDPKEQHLATVLARQGYVRSDSMGYPNSAGDFMANRVLQKATV